MAENLLLDIIGGGRYGRPAKREKAARGQR